MNPQKRFRPSGSLVSAIALFTISCACLVGGTIAQSTAAVATGGSSSNAAPTPFLVAPSFPVTGAPTGVAMGDLNQDGKLDLVTIDAVSGKVTVFLGTGDGKFASGMVYSDGSHPTAVAIADLNGDGRLEIVASNEAEGTITVLTSGVDGKLQLKQSLAVGFSPALLATGDFNGDGKTDIVVTAKSGTSLAILLNDGEGNLQKPVLSPLQKAPSALTVADFNNDDHVDLALANQDGTISLLLGAGNGTFRPVSVAAPGAGSLSSIVAGDFNGDGKMDLAVTQGTQKTLSVLLGKGDGSFESAHNYSTGINPVSTIVSDFDGDGVADLVAINQGSNTFSVLKGNGDGTFLNAVDFVVGNSPLAAVAGDIDGDGRLDLAVLNTSSLTVTVALGNGDGTFKAARSYPAEINPRAVATADLNGDKLPDLAVTNYCGADSSCKGGTVDIFLAAKNGTYELAHTYPVGAGPVSVALLDVDGDKHPDIVALNRLDKTISVLIGKGDGSFEQPVTFSLAEAPIAVSVGDFNQDGKPDLAVLEDCGAKSCSQPGSVEILLGDGGGGFKSAATYAVGYSPASIAVADLNQDKNLDLVVANLCGDDATCKSAGTATVLLGSATGKFKTAADATLGKGPSSIALPDLSGRGIPDLVASRTGDNTISVQRGNGDGTFGAATAYKVGNAPGSVTVADFNGDGKPDVAIVNAQDATVSVFFGKGDGTLGTPITLPVGAGPESLVATPTSQSGHSSLITANGNSGSPTPGRDISVLSNFEPDFGSGTVTFAVTSTPAAVSVNGTASFKIVVSGASGTPTGNVTVETTSPVTFLENGAISTCTKLTLDPTGTATCTTDEFSITEAGQTFDQFQVDYSGDTNYATSDDPHNQFRVDVTQATPTVAVSLQTGSSSPLPLGTAVTFLAAVGDGGPAIPAGGTVSFIDETNSPFTTLTCTNAGAGTLSAGTGSFAGDSIATCTISSLTSGTHKIFATYSGTDLNFTTPATSTTALSQVVGPVTPTVSVTLTSGTSPSNFASPVTFTATVAGTSPLPLPTGTVTFVDESVTPFSSLTSSCTNASAGSLTAGTGANSGDSVATCTISTLTPGSHTIYAVYNPATTDKNYVTNTSASPGLTQSVNQVTPSVAVTLSPVGNSSTFGSAVTFLATITGVTGLPAPKGGAVTFADGANGLTCSNTIALTSGTGTSTTSTATCTISTLLGGNNQTINATYTSATPTIDPNYSTASSAATSTGLQFTVNPLGTSTKISSSENPSNVNDSVTFTATVSYTPATPVLSPAPTGTVSFKLNGVLIPSCSGTNAVSVTALATAACTVPASSLPAPSDTIDASYTSGDNNYASSIAPTFTQTVNPLLATVTLVPSAGPYTVGTPVTYTATISASAVSPIAPGGTVSFTINGQSPTNCGTGGVVPVVNETAVCKTAQFLVSPTDQIVATYTPATSPSNFIVNATSGTSSVTLTFGKSTAQTALVFSNSPAYPTVNESVTFTATVTGTGTPTGSVTFSQGTVANVLCSAVTINPSGVAKCPFTFTQAIPSPGVSIIATYSGDTNFTAGSGASITAFEVLPTSTTTSVSTTVSTPTVNQAVPFLATIVPGVTPFTGSTSPTGSVSFSFSPSAGITGCSTSVSVTTKAFTTTAGCNAAFTVPGPYAVTANYISGDGNFSNSSKQFSFTISASSTNLVITPALPTTTINTPVNYSSTLTFPSGGVTPAGSVAYVDVSNTSTATLCTATLTVNSATTAIAQCSASLSGAGLHLIEAQFASTSNGFGSANSDPVNLIINKATPAVSKPSPSPAAVTVDQPVTYSVTISQVSPMPTPAGSVQSFPTGTVSFNFVSTSGGTPTVACNAVTITPGTVSPATSSTASCKFSFPAEGTYTVTASYNGDPNFAISSATSASLLVGTTVPTVSISSPTAGESFVVNQQGTFSASVVKPGLDTGSILPTGTIAFTDTTVPASPVMLCTASLPTGSVTASCTSSFTLEGARTITATYTSGDSNFGGLASGGGTVTNTVTPTVNANTPTITVTPSPTTVVATQSVLFTALVVQQAPKGALLTGTAVPTGSIAFTSSDNGSTPICTVPVTPGSSGTASAICAYAFKSTTSGAPTITANYTSGDLNFNSGTGTSSPAPTVENFCLAFTAADCNSSNPPETVLTISQGNSNSSDPFSKTSLAVNSVPIGSFTDSLNLSCQVTNSSGSATISFAPICTLTPSTLPGSGSTPSSVTISALANTPVDQYTVTITATDSKFANLSHQTVEQLVVNVVSTTGALSLAVGSSATQGVEFDTAGTPAGTTLVSFACGTILPAPTTGSFSCSGPLNPVPVSTPFTTASITITVNSGAAPALQQQRSGTVAGAAFWSVPFLALVIWIGNRKSARRNFFRFLGTLLVFAALANVIGCGGSFTRLPTQTGGPTPGTYLVQVVATDSARGTHTAIIPVTVVSNQ